ncbi:hypothetical protein FPCIR_1385 [Fusarium pseudocircinatum]|uniref:Guanylate-binding protein N-terminal domain-containing protein n=1 Tax=Fusarium pseudocircinatum TaxID=56676 RepID=A0A8H5UXT8_9HYPO|nr:hypothetical protein FPCIR_1385 [Fusarium pseudocircinatum]
MSDTTPTDPSVARHNQSPTSLQWLTLVPSRAPKSPSYSLKIHEEPANQSFRSVKHALNLVTVLGPMRSGKSTLLNLLSSNSGDRDQFGTGSGIDSVTKGAFITTPTTALVEPSNSVSARKDQQISVSFVDTEGKGDQGQTYETGLLCPILLVSKVIIFNFNSGVQSNHILQELGILMQTASKLCATVSPDSPNDLGNSSKSGPLFSHLFIVFNQLRSRARVDHVTAKLLNEEAEIDDESRQRNTIRQLLLESFETVKIFDELKAPVLRAVRSGEDVSLYLDDFEPSFVDSFSELKSSLSKALEQPRTLPNGAILTGAAIARFMVHFARSFDKSGPVHIPTVYETVQNQAVNQAYKDFSCALRDQYEALSNARPWSVTAITNKYDIFTDKLLTQLNNDIAYMPPQVVTQISGRAHSDIKMTRDNLVKAIQEKSQRIIVLLLEEQKKAIMIEFQTLLKDQNAIMQYADIEERCKLIRETHITSFKNKCDESGVQESLEDSVATLDNEVRKGQVQVEKASTDAWSAWESLVMDTARDNFIQKLEQIRHTIPFREEEAYGRKEEEAYNMALGQVQTQLPDGLSNISKQQIITKFQDLVKVARRNNKSIWYDEKNTRDIIAKESDRLVVEYRIRLAESVDPDQQPEEYHKIIHDVDMNKILEDICTNYSISSRLRDEVMNSFSSRAFEERRIFQVQYQKMVREFLSNLEGRLQNKISETIWNFGQELELIGHEKHNVTDNGRTVVLQCRQSKEKTRQGFLQALRRMIKEPTKNVRTLEEKYEHELEQGLQAKLENKLSRFNIIAENHNFALRIRLLAPIENRVLNQEYARAEDFHQDVHDTEAQFYEQAWGTVDPGGDAQKQWQRFKDTTFIELQAEVERGADFPSLDAKDLSSDTGHLQKRVIERILPLCVKITSWLVGQNLGPECYQSPILDLGIRGVDPPQENDLVPHTFRATFLPISTFSRFFAGVGYQHDLEFFDWTFEILDVSWGRPIVTEAAPRFVNDYEYGDSPGSIQTKIGTQITKTTTFTNNVTFGAKRALESSINAGYEKIWSTGLKLMINQELSFTSSMTATSNYVLNTEHTVNIPPNCPSTVTQSVSEQRARCAYIATVKMVPRMRICGNLDLLATPSISLFPLRNYETTACDRLVYESRGDSETINWGFVKRRLTCGHDRDLVFEALSDPELYSFRVKGYWEGVCGERVSTRYDKRAI